jgi:hypothetical protein
MNIIMKSMEGWSGAPVVAGTYLLIQGDGTVGALINTGAAVYALLLVDDGNIGYLDGRLGANILASSASNAILGFYLYNHSCHL